MTPSTFICHEGKRVNNGDIEINGVNGALEAIIISDDEDTSNAAKAVTIVATLAPGFTVTFGPVTIWNAPNIFHPRKLMTDAALANLTGQYGRYHLAGKVTVTVASGDANDVTRVRLIVEP